MGRLQLLLDRAAARGEIPRIENSDMISAVFPAFMLHRVVFGGSPPDEHYARRIVDEVLIPLATGGNGREEARRNEKKGRR